MTASSFPQCRFCHEPLRISVIDLGRMPLANSYLTRERLAAPEPVFPLHARVCSSCRLVQVDNVAAPADIFMHYAYFSSYTASWVEHACRFTRMAAERWHLGVDSLVVEVASNDGYLLRHFVDMDIPVLGIEPAANVAEAALAAGVETQVAFFGRVTAERLQSEGRAADLIVGNNVLAHVPDINDFVAGLSILLKPDGVVSLEIPHLIKLVEMNQFDTIYHEHFSYLSLFTIEKILGAHGLKVFDVTELPTHGGSLRIMASRKTSRAHREREELAIVRRSEATAGIDSDSFYSGLEPKVRAIRTALLDFLHAAKTQNKTVVAYGAAAKGNTLLNYCGIGTDLVEYVADLSPHKQGMFLPGSRLPIHAPSRIAETRPDYVLILPWNIKDEIVTQMYHVREWGARFVVAIPALTVLP
jgi:SAM-dependent methyltransferase